MARTARRDVIGLLIEKQVPYTEVEADALIAQAKKRAKVSGRTVRAEAELLLSRDRETRLRDLQNKVLEANKLLAAITVEVDDLRAESGDDDGELAAIMATMATSCEPFTSHGASPRSAIYSKVDRHEPKPRRGNSDVGGAVEVVMTPGHTISIVPTLAHVEVRLAGHLLAATDQALKLDETGLPARYYLPADDVKMDLLRPTNFHTNCPFKGEASYWSLDIDGEIHDGIVWSYETPTAQAAEVRGMLSFYPDRTEVTVNGQSLRD